MAASAGAAQRFAAFLQDVGSWTVEWEMHRPETRGRYYFGDGRAETGLLTRYLPYKQFPAAWSAWKSAALGIGAYADFVEEISKPAVSEAVLEMDAIAARHFAKHFGRGVEREARAEFLEGVFGFAGERVNAAAASCGGASPDLAWFSCAVQIEAAQALQRDTDAAAAGPARRALMLAGVAAGCPWNFVWRDRHKGLTAEAPDPETHRLLQQLGMQWADDFDAAATEVHALFRVREWGEDALSAVLR